MMYNHYYEYRVPLSERLPLEIQRLFLVLIGVVLLVVAPILQNYILQEDYEQLEKALKVFKTKQDLWQVPELIEEAEDIKVESFERIFIQTYDVKVSSKYHVYEGEISFSRMNSTIEDTTEGMALDITKILRYVGIACIVINLVWYVISKWIQMSFSSFLEEIWYKLRPHLDL